MSDLLPMVLGLAHGRDLRRNRIVAIILVVVAGVWWFTRKPPPAVESVDGLYSNPCCDPIRLDHGVFDVGTERVAFRLSNMKFGLIAYPVRNVVVDGGHVVKALPTDDEHRIGILFDKDHRGFTLLGPSQREYRFVRK